MAVRPLPQNLSSVVAASVGRCNEMVEAAHTISLSAKILGKELDQLHAELLRVFSAVKAAGHE
jgi:hypothetical protein